MKRNLGIQRDILGKAVDSRDWQLLFEVDQIMISEFGVPEEIDYSAPDWSDEQVYNIELMVADGLLGKREINDPELTQIGEHETYIFATSAGHDFLENFGFWKRSWNNIVHNLPTIITSVVSAVLVSWIIYYMGAPAK